MRKHREQWESKHGPIPKGWVLHHMNGDNLDNRDENLACVPRDDTAKVIPPYRARIRELERLLKESKEK